MTAIEDLRASGAATTTLAQVATILGVDRRTAGNELSVNGGDIPSLRVGRRIVIPTEPFLAMLLDNHEDEQPDPLPAATPVPPTVTLIRGKLLQLVAELDELDAASV